MSYQLTSGDQIIRHRDNALIPADNPQYLEWRAAGNFPEPPQGYTEPPSGYLAFWDALLVSNVYQTIRAQALTSPAVLVACTEFIAAFSDAKVGRPNVPAIQACINNLMQAGTFTPEELGELQGLLVYANLQDLFTLTP